MTIGKTSALKEYYNARNPMLVILKHKSPEFFKRYFWNHLRKSIFKQSVRVVLLKGEFKKAFKIWQRFFSELLWGFKNKKFTLKHFI